jgi:hypothetical protein
MEMNRFARSLKRLLRGFVLPGDSFGPRGFLPRQPGALSFKINKRKKAVVFGGVASFALVGSLVSGSLFAVATDDGSTSTVDNSISFNLGVTGQYASGPTNNFPNVTTNATWETWLFPTTTSAAQLFMDKEFAFVFSINNGIYHWAFGSGTTWGSFVSTGTSASLNQWQHVAYVKSGSNMLFYLNGQLAYSAPLASTTLGTNNNPFRLGDRLSSNSMFNGRMDEVRVWNVARSQADIARDMHLKIDPTSQTGLLGYWDFNEPSGNTVYNRVSGAPNLTLTGSPPRLDVKQVSSAAGGDTVITFPRTYLPGVGGWTVPSGAADVRALVVAEIGRAHV